MTFEQLKYFIAITEHPTFLDAAESLHMSQSALSKQIMKLEKELGILLLDRSHRNAKLTEAGTIFYQEAKALIRQYDQMLSRMRSYKDASRQEIHVGTLPILNQYQLTPLFKKFTELNPGIHITIAEIEEQELLNGLNTGLYDVIIARANMVNSRQYTAYPLREDELMAILPDSHRLAGRTSLKLSDIANEDFILMNPYTSIYHLCIDNLKSCGIKPNIIRTARVESILSAVSIGDGISLLAKSNLRVFHHENIAAIPLNPPIRLPVVIARKKADPADWAVKNFIHYFLS